MNKIGRQLKILTVPLKSPEPPIKQSVELPKTLGNGGLNGGKYYMNKAAFILFLITSVAVAKELHFNVLNTAQGKFTNVTVIPATANSVMVLHAGGATGVAFTNLSSAVQNELGYAPPQPPDVSAQLTKVAPAVPVTNAPPAKLLPRTPQERLAAFQLERTNAWQRVIQIINRPVQAYVRTSKHRPVSRYSPGWFHDGAIKPDFNNVDIRQSQDLNYGQSQYVTSDLNPGKVFLGADVEFNSMTKFFYVDRTLPKRKLTEPEMLEVNKLYRVIGRCEDEMARLETAR